MRLNTPVIDREHPFPAGETLVSTTDLKGRITYCNPAFLLVSGFTREELLGQPHNIIRHPNMPEEAFRDMWQTIRSGQPWSAPVQNRRKDGSYYWVKANVTPLLEDHRVVGYMSVRTPPHEKRWRPRKHCTQRCVPRKKLDDCCIVCGAAMWNATTGSANCVNTSASGWWAR